MKRTALIFLTIAILSLSFSPVLSEDFGAFQQLIDSLSSGDFASVSWDSLPSDCSSTWTDDSGATWTVVCYTETTTYDASGSVVSTVTQPAAQNSGTLAEMMDWIDTQVKTQAAESAQSQTGQQTWSSGSAGYTAGGSSDSSAYDPSVFYTARPAATPKPQKTAYTVSGNRGFQYQMRYDDDTEDCFPRYTQTVRNEQPAENTASGITAPVTSTVSTGDYTTTDASMQEQKLLNLINEDRARNGLPALTLDPELSKLAQLKSDDMNNNNYFAHESPTYGNAGQMLDSFNYDYQGVGENIAHHSDVEKAEAAFMSSDGHRQNILGSQWDKVGLGITVDKNGYVYVTQLFAR